MQVRFGAIQQFDLCNTHEYDFRKPSKQGGGRPTDQEDFQHFLEEMKRGDAKNASATRYIPNKIRSSMPTEEAVLNHLKTLSEQRPDSCFVYQMEEGDNTCKVFEVTGNDIALLKEPTLPWFDSSENAPPRIIPWSFCRQSIANQATDTGKTYILRVDYSA